MVYLSIVTQFLYINLEGSLPHIRTSSVVVVVVLFEAATYSISTANIRE